MSDRVAVAGASGYAGGELLRLAARPPRRRDRRRSPRAPAPGRCSASTSRTSSPLADRVARADRRRGPGRPRRGLPRPARTAPAAAVAAALPPDVVVVDCGADHRLADPHAWADVLRRRPRGHLAVRSARAVRGRRRAPARRAARGPPGRRARLLPDGRHRWRWPRVSPPACSSRTSSSSRRSGTSGAGRAAQAAPARQRGDGLDEPVRRRRRAPPHPRDGAEPRAPPRASPVRCPSPRRSPRWPAGSSRPARRALATGAAPRGRARRSLGRGVRRRAVRPRPARGALAADRRHARGEHRAPPGRGRRAGRPGRRRGRRRQPHQGHRRGRGPVRQPRARPARDHGPAAGGVAP